MPNDTAQPDAQPAHAAQREIRFASGELLIGSFAPGEPDRVDAPQYDLPIDSSGDDE